MRTRPETRQGDVPGHLYPVRPLPVPENTPIEEPEVNSNSRILVLAPHLEDPIIGCGGTMCKLGKRGAHVKVLYMTDPSYGNGDGPSSGPGPMEKKKDAADSLALLRCYESECLGFPGLEISCGIQIKRLLLQVIECYSPDIAFIPSVHDLHPDNMMTGLLAASALMEYDRRLTLYSYDVWGGLFPNNLIDISDVMEDKLAAISSCGLRCEMDNSRNGSTEGCSFRLSSVQGDRHYEPFLRQNREDFVIMAWQYRAYGYVDGKVTVDTDRYDAQLSANDPSNCYARDL
ncbi:MAG TPA: PIG-L deacetylase family protein [Methanomassiliicoccales archaeon]|jgi:LmbE family N-acetylglucosaminyl deacetylase